MEELNGGKSPYVGVFTNSQEVANGRVIWSDRRTMKIWPIKRMPVWGTALRKFDRCIEEGRVHAHQKSSLPGLKDDGNRQAAIPGCSLERAIGGL